MSRLIPFFFIALWQGCAQFFAWPEYFIPAPSRIIMQIVADRTLLMNDFYATSKITLIALFCACLCAFVFASLAHFFKNLKALLSPLTFILQVTPIIALAPLLLIYATPYQSTLIIAILIAFYPLFTGFISGFEAIDPSHNDLFRLYKASSIQKFKLLELPTSLPFFLVGLKIATGLALVGTVVGEFTAGAGNGLAIRLLESQYRLNIPRLYACLVLIILLGFLLKFLMPRQP